jgi:hypothetical protein
LRHPLGPPEFAYTYTIILLSVIVPTILMFGAAWGLYPHSVGLKVGIAPPIRADDESPLIIEVYGNPDCSDRADAEIRLGSRTIALKDLPDVLRSELTRRGRHTVYIRGHGCLQAGDVFHVVDLAQEAWYGVWVVLLTPRAEKHAPDEQTP